MSETLICAVLTLVGTLVGTLGGIMASSKLLAYRIEQLEKKVEKHNNLVERMYKVEQQVALIQEHIEFMEDEQ